MCVCIHKGDIRIGIHAYNLDKFYCNKGCIAHNLQVTIKTDSQRMFLLMFAELLIFITNLLISELCLNTNTVRYFL